MEISQLYSYFREHPTITTDTRDCPPDSLFFALKGASFDGNKFALDALAKGCAYAVVDDAEVAAQDERLLLVDNVLTTLQELAAYHRQMLGTPIIQITGTNGKTTTKELTAAVLKEAYRVLATTGNFNNHIGVPKTLLQLTAEDEIAVVETGANHPGEIAALTSIVDPDCGLITNVGKAHLEGFGSFEGVVKTKSELYDYLRTKQQGLSESSGLREPLGEVSPEAPFVFLHADDEILTRQSAGLNVVRYGQKGQGYEVEGEIVTCNPFLKLRWKRKEGEWQEVQTQLIGDYNLPNVLAACTVGAHFGVSDASICKALENYRPSNNRSEYRKTEHNRLVIDAYNANVSSMHAAINNFANIDEAGKMMILGEMRELGTASQTAHQEIAAHAAQSGIEALWLVGEAFRDITPTDFKGQLLHFDTTEELKTYIISQSHKPENKLILIKGSNGTKLFEIPTLL